MCKKLPLFFIAVFLIASLQAQTTYTVCASGCDHTTITAAVTAATAGDNIVLLEPIHSEANITITKSLTLCGGSPTGNGGALYTIQSSGGRIFTINMNVVFTVNDLAIENAMLVGDFSGGAIQNNGTLNLQNCSLRNNKARRGGAVYSEGTLTINRCTFRSNSTADAGGNRAQGGALAIGGGTATIINSTFSGNSINSSNNAGRGGAIDLALGTLTLQHVTITNNSIIGNAQPLGSGLSTVAGSTLDMTNVIIYGNTGGNGFNLNAAGTFTTNTTNIVPAGGCNGAGCTGKMFITADPQLGALADNGGCTLTHSIPMGSSADDTGTAIMGINVDQRNAPRDAMVDIGAFEEGGVAPACDLALPVELSSFTVSAQGHSAVLIWTTLTETNNQEFIVERSAGEGAWLELGSVAGMGTSLQPVNYQFTDYAPSTGINYYRLRQIDYDGAYEYSPVVAAEFAGTADRVRVAPNPFTSETTLAINAAALDGLRLQLFNTQGQLLRDLPVTDARMRVTRDGLPAGVYHYRIGGAGQWLGQGRLVIAD